MTDHPENAVLVITVLDTGDDDMFRVELWARDAMSREELLARLRRMANDFEHGDLRRIE